MIISIAAAKPFAKEVINKLKMEGNEIYIITARKNYDEWFPKNLQDKVEEIGLTLSKDYYHEAHTNIHGSLKFTYYLGKYLSENYDFEDKRENLDYESWNMAYDKYLDIISPYVPDFELNHEKRDVSLLAPKLLECNISGSELELKWEKNEGADGYLIYCRTSVGKNNKYTAWKYIGEAGREDTSYSVKDLDSKMVYNYTVVPIRNENDTTYFGNYNMNGISGKVVKKQTRED